MAQWAKLSQNGDLMGWGWEKDWGQGLGKKSSVSVRVGATAKRKSLHISTYGNLFRPSWFAVHLLHAFLLDLLL